MKRSFASLAGVYMGLFLCLGSAGQALPETVLLELTNHWRYEQTSNLDGVNWMDEDFDDRAWPQGAGLLYYDSYPYLSPKGTQLAPGQITYYFRSHFTFPFTTDQAVLVFSNLIDDGAVFYLNGVEIQRLRMPGYPTPISYTNLATGQPSSGHALYFDGFVCTAGVLTNLRRGDNVLAVEVHQISAGSADIAFGSRLAVQLPPPVAQVQLALPSKVYEGSASNLGALYLSSAFTNDIPVQLISPSPELLLPGVVTIAAGATNVLFGFDVTDNAILEGPRAGGVWTVWQDTGFASGSVTICDDEQVAISIELPASVLEGDTSKTGSIVFSQPPSMDVTVKLSSTNVNAVAIPATTVIPAGQTSAVFNLSIVDDPWVDGPEGTIITAEVAGWPPVSATITVLDNENNNLTVSLPASVREGDGLGLGAGVVRLSGKALTNLLVTLSSSDLSELLVPSSLVITAGQSTATFDLTMLDDEIMDGTQPVTILAESAAYTGGSNITMVADNDVHHFTFDYISSPQYTGSLVTVRIVASDVNGLPIPVFSKTAELYAVCDGIPLVEFGTNLLLFSSGVWTGTVRFSSSNHLVRLVAAQIGGPEGESGPFDVELRPATILSLAGNDVVFSAGLNRLFVSVGPTDPVYPNRLVEVDPATKTIVGSYDLGPTPNRLAISANGQFIYCATTSDTAVRLFSVTNRQPGYLITPPTDPRCVPAHVIDMATVVDNPNRIVMANRFSGCSWGEIRAFENGSPLSTAIGQHTDPQSTDLESSLTPGLLYAIQDNALSRLGVSSSGVGIQAVTPTTIILPGTRFKARDNLIYSVAGHVIDPATFAQVGSYPDGSCEFEVEPLVRRTFFVKSQAQPNSYSVNVFDQLGFFPIDSLSITGVFNGPRKFIRYGTNGLAMVTASELVLIESPWLIPSLPATDLIISQQITPNPTNGGSNYFCTITVSNCGPNLASRVVVKDTLPSTCLLVSSNFSAGGGGAQNGILDWRIGNLAAGNSATATLIFVPVLDGYLTNGIIALSQTADTNFVNNVSTIIAKYPAANLSIAEILSPNSIVPGSDSACTFVVSNAGPNTAFQVQVLAQLSPQLTILSNSMGQGLVRQTGTGASWHVDSIPPGGTASLTFYLRSTQSGWFDTRASVSSWSTDTNTADNTVSRALFVQANFNQGFVACIQSSTEDVMYDPWRGRIVASTGMNAALSNSIVVVNPDTGLVESFMSLGQKPRRIACSDDGQFLYVSMPEIATVRRLDLGTLATEQEFSLGGEWIYDLWYPSYAADMAVAPGEPLSLAVWRVRRAGPMASEHGQGVALVENGVMRSNVTATGGGYSVEFDTDTRILYAGDASGRKLYRCAIDEGGVTFTNEVVLPNSVRAEVVYAAGRLFNTSARVLDPQSLRVTGIYPGSEKAILVSPDAVNHRIWFLTKTNSTHCWLAGYNMDNFDTLGTLLITNVSGVPGSLITCGPNRLSFRTSNGQLFLIRTDFAVPSVFTDLRLWQSGPAGSTAAGSNMVFTCTVSNAGPTVSLQPLLTNTFSAGCNVRSATSSYGTCQVVNGNVIWSAPNLAPRTSILITITVRSSQEGLVTSIANLSSATPDTLMDNNTAVVTARVGNPPAQDSAAALLLPARNLIWWPEAGKILATVSGILNWSNSIVSINPTTAGVRYESFVGAGANEMAFSGDKVTLFVSMDYSVQMLDVPSMARSGRFVVDSGGEAMVPYDIAALPTTSNSLAVVRKWYAADIAVFDAAVMRSNTGALSSSAGTIATGDTDSVIYTQSPAGGFRRYSVDARGVTLTNINTTSPVSGAGDLEWGNGVFYSTSGAVIDPTLPAQVGRVPGVSANSLVKYDSPSRRVFYLTQNGTSAALQAFDTNTLASLGTLSVTGLVGTASSLIRWGTDGLAFLTTGGQVFLLHTSLLPTNPPTDLAISLATANTPYVVGSSNILNLIITNIGLNRATGVTWSNTLPPGVTVVSVTASSGSITNSGSIIWGMIDTLDAGSAVNARVVFRPGIEGFHPIAASVTSTALDLTNANNTASALIWIQPAGGGSGPGLFSLNTKDVICDAARKRLFASMGLTAGALANTVVIIDPAFGNVSGPYFVGGDPGRLAVSADGQFLYVALDGDRAVQRIRLSDMALDLRFGTPNSLVVADMAVDPTNPELVALRCTYGGISLHERGVKRPKELSSVDLFAFSDITGELYACSSGYSGVPLYHVDKGPAGVALLDQQPGKPSQCLQMTFARGLLYYSRGMILNPETRRVLATLPIGYNALVEPDPTGSRAFSLSQASGSTWTIRAYDGTQFLELGRTNITSVSGTPTRFLRWGTNGFAFRTDSQIFIGQTTLAPTNPLTDVALGLAVSSSQALLNSNLVFTLNLTNAGPENAFGVVVTQTFSLPITNFTLSASMGSAIWTNGAIMWNIGMLTNGARALLTCDCQSSQVGTLCTRAQARHDANDPDLLNNASLVVVAVAGGGPSDIVAVPLTTGELIYDRGSGQIFVSVPASEGFIGNSVLAFDPSTGEVLRQLHAGPDPSQLAVSGDGRYLYVSEDGAMGARRLDLGGVEADLEFPFSLDALYTASDIQVQPGHPNTMAVAYSSGVAIYDGSVIRSNTSPTYQSPNLIQFSEDGNRIYGWVPWGRGYGFLRLSVTPGGVNFIDRTTTFHEENDSRQNNGLYYSQSGRVIDPIIPMPLYTNAASGLVIPDSSIGEVLYFVQNGQTWELRAFKMGSSNSIGTQTIAGVLGTPSHLVRCGSDRLAFRTSSNQLFIVRSSLVPTSVHPPSDLIVSQTATQDTTTLPADRLVFSVTVSNAGPGDLHGLYLCDVLPQPIAAFNIQCTQGQWTCFDGKVVSWQPGPLSARASAQLDLTVTITNTMTFTNFVTAHSDVQDPVLSNNLSQFSFNGVYFQPRDHIRKLSLASLDLAYDRFRNRLYATLADTNSGPRIGWLDPATGLCMGSLPVREAPQRLAISDNGQFLYVSFVNTSLVERIDLTSETVDFSFTLPGRHPDVMKVLPGHPDSLAVSYFDGTTYHAAVFDGGIPRPLQVDGLPFKVFEITPDAQFLFGYAVACGGPCPFYYKMSLTTNGMAIISEGPGGWGSSWGSTADMAYHAGLLYSGNGEVLNATNWAQGPDFPRMNSFQLVELKTEVSRIVYLAGSLLAIYDLTTRRQLAYWDLPGVSGSDSLTFCDGDRLAFRSSTDIYFVRNSLIPTEPVADLALRINSTPTNTFLGSPIVYSLTVSNAGPNIASNVVVRLPLTNSFILGPVALQQGTYATNRSYLDCNLGTMLAGNQATISITFTGAVIGIVANVMSVFSSAYDTNDANNFATFQHNIALPQVSVSDAQVLEGNVGLTNAIFTVSVNASSILQTVTVVYATVNGSATAPLDLVPVTGTLTFSPGTNTLRVAVPIHGDTFSEQNETFTLLLSSAINATLGRASATGTIFNDDGIAGQLSALHWSVLPATLYSNAPFQATVSALDSSGNLVTTFNGTALLSTHLPELSVTNGDFETGTLPPWEAIILSNSVVPFDILGKGQVSYAYRLCPSQNRDGIRQSVRLRAGMTYSCDLAIAQSLEDTSANLGDTEIHLLINTNEVAAFDFGFNFTPGPKTTRTNLHGIFLAPTTGVYTASLLIYRPWNLSSALFGVVDDFRITPDTLPHPIPNVIQFTNGLWSGQMALSGEITNILLRADDGNGHYGDSGPLNVLAPPDMDQDFIPDYWEVANGLNCTNATDACADTDLDSLSNLQEFWAGTDPNNPGSVLKLFPGHSAVNPSNAELTFTAQPLKTYSVHYTEQLNPAVWHYYTNFPAASGIRVIRLPVGNAGEKRFYRIATPQMDVMPTVPQISVRTLPGGTNIAIRFDAALNQSYEIQYTDRIGSTNWSSLTTYTAVPTNRVIEYVLPRTDSKLFFRVFSQTQ